MHQRLQLALSILVLASLCVGCSLYVVFFSKSQQQTNVQRRKPPQKLLQTAPQQTPSLEEQTRQSVVNNGNGSVPLDAQWIEGAAARNSSVVTEQGSQGDAGMFERTTLLNVSGDEAVEKTVRGLNNLQVSCQDRPQSYQRELGQRYTKFLEVLAVYTDFHTHERQRESARRLVWVCDVRSHCGGLADRIKGITHALVLAMLSRRVLLLDWHGREFGEQTYLEPNLIDWRLTEEERKKGNHKGSKNPYPGGDSMASFRMFCALGGIEVDMPADKLKRYIEEIKGNSRTWIVLASNMRPSSIVYNTKTAPMEWLKEGVATLGLNTLPAHEIDALVGLVFRYLFRFSGEVPGEVEGARRVLGLQHQPYVGVHVRTGFVGSGKQEPAHPKLYQSPRDWEKTLTCAHKYATENFTQTALLFLATDSNLVKKKALQSYRGQVRTLGRPLVHVDYVKSGRELREGVLSMWVELVLLAESCDLVMGESGFAFLAKSICLMPRTHTIRGLTCKPLEKTYIALVISTFRMRRISGCGPSLSLDRSREIRRRKKRCVSGVASERSPSSGTLCSWSCCS